MDHRDIAGHFRSVLQDVNQRTMQGTFTFEDADGTETEHVVHLRFDVCETCQGRGAHVNPGVDSHGLTAADFAEDPDFAEDYCAGAYDVPCAECKGRRVVPVVDEATTNAEIVALYRRLEDERWQAASDTVREREM